MSSLELLCKYEELSELYSIKKMRYNEMLLSFINDEIQVNPIEFKYRLKEHLAELEELKERVDNAQYHYLKAINYRGLYDLFGDRYSVEEESEDEEEYEELEAYEESDIEDEIAPKVAVAHKKPYAVDEKAAILLDIREKMIQRRITIDHYNRSIEKKYHHRRGDMYSQNGCNIENNVSYQRVRGYTYRRRVN